MSNKLNRIRKRILAANKAHVCAACGAALHVLTADEERAARADGYAQGMTDAQMDDPSYGAKVCDACWRDWEARGFPGMTRPS